MGERTHAYCPACREESALDRKGRCLWCGGTTKERKRGGWKRPDLAGSRYTEAQLRALHAAHLGGDSINSLAERTFEKVDYGSRQSAAVAISREWKRMGLAVRDRVEQVKRTCTVHGMAPKHGPRPGYATYKRRVLRGIPDQPRCKAVRTQPPRKGDPCQRPAMKGSEFCANHAPERQEHRAAHLERVRSRKSPVPMVPMAPLVEWLHRRHAELGTWAAVGFRVGLDKALVHRYALGLDGHRQPKHEIGEDTVRRMLDTDGSAEFADLYPTERIAA